MKFPELLTKAVFKNSKVCFYQGDLDNDPDDKMFVEYLDFKAHHTPSILDLAALKKLHKQGLYTKEIHKLFAKNNRLSYLEEKSRSKAPRDPQKLSRKT